MIFMLALQKVEPFPKGFNIMVPSQKYRSAKQDSFLSACLPCLEKSELEGCPGWILSFSASKVPPINFNEFPSAIW